MHWLYRLQQRLAVTPAESTALLTLTVLFIAGLGAQQWQRRLPPVDERPYALADSLFAAANTSAHAAADTSAGATAAPDSAAPPDTAAYASADGRIHLNRADAATLEGLPRIGPKTAARIVAYRAAHGPFRRVQDLTAVTGIGEKTLAEVAPFVYVDD